MTAFYACKEERNLPLEQRQDLYVQLSSSDGPLIQKQLTWIAKGLAGAADQYPGEKNAMHDIVITNEYFAESHENVDDVLQNATGFDLAREVDDWLRFNQPNNDYDASYFFDIDIDDCPGKVSIRIPDGDIADQTKLHVVTLDNPLNPQVVTPGYFISSTTGTLDSLDITENNMDSVYLWIVGVDNDCSQTIDSCGDGILGDTEDCETCPEDCSASYPDFDRSLPAFKLSLKEFKTFTDFKNGAGHPLDQYQEAHLQGRYEVNFSYGVYETVDGQTFDGSWDEIFWFTDPNTGKDKLKGTKKSEKIGKYSAWGKNAKIRRTNLANNKSNRGTHYVDVVNMVMADTIQPHKDNFFFCVFEKDYFLGVLGSRNDNAIWSNSWSYSYEGGQNSGIPPAGLPYGWDGTDNWRIVSFTLDANNEPGPPFIPAGPNEWLYFADLGGEAEAIFKLEQI